MKRSIHTYLIIKNLLIIAVLVILISPSQVVAVNYIFEEDFSGSNFDDWKFEGRDYNRFIEGGPVNATEHYISVTDKKLVSNRQTGIPYLYDWAIHPTNLKNGVWEFTATRNSPSLAWGFFLVQGEMDWIGQNYANINEKAIYIFFTAKNSIVMWETNRNNGTSNDYFSDFLAVDSTFNNVNKEYKYHIARNENKIHAFINNVEVATWDVRDEFNEFKYFGIFTETSVSFDNFKVTADLDILSQPQPKDSDDGFISTNVVIVISTVTLLALLYKFYFSKKKYLEL